MNNIKKYLLLIGFVPQIDLLSSDRYIKFKSPTCEDWITVTHYGRDYNTQYVKVYTKDAISVSKYSSTRMVDIIKWIEQIK